MLVAGGILSLLICGMIVIAAARRGMSPAHIAVEAAFVAIGAVALATIARAAARAVRR